MLYSTGSSAWSFLEGLNLLPALAEWLQVAVLSSDIFLQQFREKWEYGFPHSILPVFLVFNMEELPFKHNEEAISTKFSTLCITPNNRGPFDVERV